MKEYGVLLIGCGYIGMQHLEDLYYRRNIRMAAVVDENASAAAEAAEKYFVPDYGTDYRRFLSDDRVDIVIIATYTNTHLTILSDCLRSGKHVLCEKPIAANIEDGRRFLKLVKDAETKVLVAHILRHNKTYRKIRELIQSGLIGEVKVVRMVQNHHAVNWPRYRRLLEDTTPIVDCGVHYIDAVQWLLSTKITGVSCVGTTIDADSPNRNYTMMTFKTDTGCIGFYEAGWSLNISAGCVKDFVGSKGRISLKMKSQRTENREEGDLITVYISESGEYRSINMDVPYKDMYGQMMSLIDMIENDSPGEPAIDEVFSAFEIALRAQAQLKL